jgi:hypothetical protein
MITTDDRIAIQELLARFAHYSDYAEWDKLATLYVPDVVTETVGIDMVYEGVDSQIEHARESDRQTDGKNRHYYFNVFVEEEGDDVFVNFFVMNVNAGASPMAAKMVVTGRHRDKVVKTDDGWKFARRSVTFDQSFELNF